MPATTKTKKPQDHKPKQNGFGKKSLHDLELPSGYSIKVQRPGVEGLVRAGVLESFDSLTSIVQGETIPKAEGKRPINAEEVVADPENVKKMMGLLNKIVIFVVAEPKLDWPYIQDTDENGEPLFEINGDPIWKLDEHGEPVYISDDDRDGDKNYVDYVDIEDKTFIMNYAVGGSADLQRFREATQEALGGVRDGEAAEEETV